MLLDIDGSQEGYVPKYQCFISMFLFYALLVHPLDATMSMVLFFSCNFLILESLFQVIPTLFLIISPSAIFLA